jgi:hypothetical protein
VNVPNNRIRQEALRGIASVLAAMALVVPVAHAQSKGARAAESDPAEVLEATLAAACRRDAAAFAKHLTAQTAVEFGKLTESQRGRLMGRLAMLNAAGNVLLSSSTEGHPVVRCDAGGAITELRLGAPEAEENLAFVPAEAHAADVSRTVRFGLVRESGQWRLISIGLLLLDLPAMAKEWVEADVHANEVKAVACLHEIADALDVYRRAFDQLPEGLDQLGPAGKDGLSPDHAGLLDEALAAGECEGYRFRYVIVPAQTGAEATQAERNKQAGFALAATPTRYGQAGAGRRSFYLDSGGTLRGDDKQGEVATSSDPEIEEPRR